MARSASPRAWRPDPLRLILLERPLRKELPRAAQPVPAGTPSRVELSRHEPREVELRVFAERQGVVVLRDSWYPGWKAELDGQRVETLKADAVLRGVVVGPGEHVLRFRFEPPLMQLGAALSLTSLTALLVLGWLGWRSDT